MQSPDVAIVRPWNPSAAPAGALIEDSLGVGYLLSSLRAAHFSATVVDAFIFGFDAEQTVDCILELDPVVVAISLHSFADYQPFKTIIERLAREAPDIMLVVGGEQATFTAEQLMEEFAALDAVVRGEGEITLPKIVATVLGKETMKEIKGAIVRSENGELLDGGFRESVGDLDELPWPHKDVVSLALQENKPVAVSLLTGRGCTHKCTFCTANTFLRLAGGKVWRRRRPDKVADEFEWLARKWAGKHSVHPMIQFQDVIFLGTSTQAKKWAEEFVSELEQRNLSTPFYFMARAEAILANEALMPRLAKVGLASVEVGIECGVDRILQLYNKRNSSARSLDAITILQDNNICYDASGYIMFDPRATLDELRENARYLFQLGHATWDRYVTRLQVFPGTELRNQLIENGLFDKNAQPDDVYAYRYEHAKSVELLQYIWMYGTPVSHLDALIHEARNLRTAMLRSGQAGHTSLSAVIEGAERLFCDHFLGLADLVEQGRAEDEFQQVMEEFYVRVHTASDALWQQITSNKLAA